MARARREVEQLAELLDSGAVAGNANGELGNLLALASSVREHVTLPTPSPDFRMALRSELLTAAAPVAPMASLGTTERLRRFVEERAPQMSQSGRLVTATAVGAAVVAAGGIMTASQQALPGDLLYGLKGTTEDLRMAFSAGDAEQGRLHLSFAGERLSEVEDGVDRLTNDLLASTLDRLDDEVLAAAEDLLAAFKATADAALVADLTDFTGDAATRLDELTRQLPAEVVPHAENSIETLRRIDVQAAIATGERAVQEACQQCGSPAVPVIDNAPPAIAKPGEGPAVPVTECDCQGPVAQPAPQPEPTEPATPEPTPTPTEPVQETPVEPDGEDVVPTLPEAIDPAGELVEEQVNDLLDQLPVNPVDSLPNEVSEPAGNARDQVNGTVGEVSKMIDDILP